MHSGAIQYGDPTTVNCLSCLQSKTSQFVHSVIICKHNYTDNGKDVAQITKFLHVELRIELNSHLLKFFAHYCAMNTMKLVVAQFTAVTRRNTAIHNLSTTCR